MRIHQRGPLAAAVAALAGVSPARADGFAQLANRRGLGAGVGRNAGAVGG
jgi:hypothetical protein